MEQVAEFVSDKQQHKETLASTIKFMKKTEKLVFMKVYCTMLIM